MEWIKNIVYFIAFCFGWVCAYTKVSQEVITILVVLMIFDSLTGYIKVAVLGGSPSSTKLGIGVVSKALLLLIPFTLALVAKGVGIELNGLATGTLATLVISEGISVITNIYIIRTGKDIKEFDIVSAMLLRIRKALLAMAQKS